MNGKSALALAALALSATALPAAKPAPKAESAARIKRGLTFAQERCAGCHAVAVNGSSPNPESPPFEDIANRPGLTETTLRTFLRDSHNYPQAMDFTVDRGAARDLAAYLVSLRRPGYKPAQ